MIYERGPKFHLHTLAKSNTSNSKMSLCLYKDCKIHERRSSCHIRLRFSQYFKNVESFLIIIFRSCNKLTIITPSNTD